MGPQPRRHGGASRSCAVSNVAGPAQHRLL